MTRGDTDCLVNGHPATAVAVADRGLAYGDGVFETIAVVDGQPRLLPAHLRRLQRGCQRLGLTPWVLEEWQSDVDQIDLPRYGGLRLSVTRGVGGQGYAPPTSPRCTRITRILPAPRRPSEWWWDGIDVRWCDTRLAIQPALAGIKHINRLEQVLARAEWQDPAIAEGLMRSTRGEVIEATSCNIIVDAGDRLLIPDTRECGVDGIMQQWLISRAQSSGIAVERAALNAEALMTSYGVMLTNSLIGLWSVRRIERSPLPRSARAQWLQALIADHRLALMPGVMAQ
ncbi:aminodeoxychorismate lyase [Spiribacter sp. 221]|uniref:aminodeoxychorismate lyase n=1 Tax=Spiribacter onubensis TaxID=3122420 RepID=UPI00349F8E8F